MSNDQVKEEIDQLLQTIPEENRIAVLEYLKTAQKVSADKLSLSRNFSQILREDQNLLERLAK